MFRVKKFFVKNLKVGLLFVSDNSEQKIFFRKRDSISIFGLEKYEGLIFEGSIVAKLS